MNDEIKEILEKLKDNIPIEECRSEGTSDGLVHYGEDEDSWQYKLLDYITKLQEKLKVSQTNEETYRLEMLDITKCLGLDEDTIFDEVKEKATNLQQENERLRKIEKFKFTSRKDETKATIVISKKDIDYKSRCEKAYKIIDEALTEQMITGNATVNLIELCAILKGSGKE